MPKDISVREWDEWLTQIALSYREALIHRQARAWKEANTAPPPSWPGGPISNSNMTIGAIIDEYLADEQGPLAKLRHKLECSTKPFAAG